MTKFIHDGNNPGFIFDFDQDRLEHMQEEGCDPEVVTPQKAQRIWTQLGMKGTFEIYQGMGMGSRVYDRDYKA
jgi:hypothetical protein